MDTSAYYAILNPKDAWHRDAIAIISGMAVQRANLFTTNFVIAEAHALALRRMGRNTALTLLTQIDSSSTTVVRVEIEDELRAREIITSYVDKNFSLVDATCFAVMERLDIPAAFTFDRNFVQYGLSVLRL